MTDKVKRLKAELRTALIEAYGDETTSVTTAGKTIVQVGKKFIIKPKAQANLTTTVRALLTVIGNETGGFKTISVTVDPTGFATLDVQTATNPLTPAQ